MTPAARTAAESGITVRDLRWTDFDSFRDIYWALYDERESQRDIGITLYGTRPSFADEVGWFTDLYRRATAGSTIVVVAEKDGVPIGHCAIRSLGANDDFESAHVGELGILVHRDHRGSGAGRALMRRSLELAARRFEVVRLSVFATNVRARRLYEEFGFAYVGTIPRVVRRGSDYFDEVLMVKEISRPSDRS